QLDGEFAFLDEVLKARAEAGLTQADVAVRVGTTQSAIARLESAATKHSPSIATLQKYAKALGYQVQIRLVKIKPGVALRSCRRRLHLGLRFHRIADAELLECAQHLGARRAGRDRCDRLRLEQRLLQRFGCADVGLRRTRAHCNAEADARDVDRRTSHELRA